MLIRPATAEDAHQICTIWNPIIRDTTITFTTDEKTPEDIEKMLLGPDPVFVAERDEHVLGFTAYGPFRNGPGYKHTKELSINLAPAARGTGIGRKLVTHLEQSARSNQIRPLIAGVSGTNSTAITFHKACGYRHVATIPQVGFKFDTWLDLVLLQKHL